MFSASTQEVFAFRRRALSVTSPIRSAAAGSPHRRAASAPATASLPIASDPCASTTGVPAPHAFHEEIVGGGSCLSHTTHNADRRSHRARVGSQRIFGRLVPPLDGYDRSTMNRDDVMAWVGNTNGHGGRTNARCRRHPLHRGCGLPHARRTSRPRSATTRSRPSGLDDAGRDVHRAGQRRRRRRPRRPSSAAMSSTALRRSRSTETCRSCGSPPTAASPISRSGRTGRASRTRRRSDR